jgi:hypothetical protein
MINSLVPQGFTMVKNGGENIGGMGIHRCVIFSVVAYLTVVQTSTLQLRANAVSSWVGCHLGWYSTVGWPLRGGRGTIKSEK